ncbi:hypothetical protein CVT25_002736 [Psilocybe cyanescens]|uniref:Uncharacterized protein n=1 Tax=Psilocybe cyanescens TaxID=93625 RepID=A0A409WL67_PSICY|nr:hypothetical protein CVT25_002736 [Psilocybe cyanescens]
MSGVEVDFYQQRERGIEVCGGGKGGGGGDGEDARARPLAIVLGLELDSDERAGAVAGILEANVRVEVAAPLVPMSVLAKDTGGVEVAVDDDEEAAEVAIDADAAHALAS